MDLTRLRFMEETSGDILFLINFFLKIFLFPLHDVYYDFLLYLVLDAAARRYLPPWSRRTIGKTIFRGSFLFFTRGDDVFSRKVGARRKYRERRRKVFLFNIQIFSRNPYENTIPV